MKNSFHSVIYWLISLVLGIFAGMCISPFNHTRHPEIQRDTTFLVDTHIIEKPVLVERTVRESLTVHVQDTIHIRDSVFLAIPMETKIYKGEGYRAEISGYKATLDRIDIYPKTTVVKERLSSYKSPSHSIGIGVEANYMSSVSVPIVIEYERMLKPWLSAYGQIQYDLTCGLYGVGAGLKMQIEW